jgi:pilus assembly protein FimV
VDNQFQPLSSGEVLSVDHSVQFLIGHSTFRISEFAEVLQKYMLEHSVGGLTTEKVDWLTEEGVPCEVLKFGATHWQKGKVRLYLEFSPEDGEEQPQPVKKAKASNVSQSIIASSVLDLEATFEDTAPFSVAEEDEEMFPISQEVVSSITMEETLLESPDLDFEDNFPESPTSDFEDNFPESPTSDFELQNISFDEEDSFPDFPEQASVINNALSDEMELGGISSDLNDDLDLGDFAEDNNDFALTDDFDVNSNNLDLGGDEDFDVGDFSDFDANAGLTDDDNQDDQLFDDVWQEMQQFN